MSERDKRYTLNGDTKDSVVPMGARWADYMWELTPVEKKSDGMWYKRDDKFALYGINTLNGSKCRQLLHLFETRPEGVDTVVHATNVNSSPQTPMTAAMAEHYGLRCIQIAGGTSFESLSKLELPLFATMFGTEYEIGSGSGFNKNLQNRVKKIMEDDFPNSFTIERDITLDHRLPENTPDKILAFHEVGAHQVKNFPDHIEDLILPFGSANSATSVMLGISKFKPKSLKRIHLVNVGVDKRDYMFERLKIMGANVDDYEIIWHDTKQPYSKTFKGISVDDITFHYRYEAKVYKYMKENMKDLFKDTTLFWIIGSVPDLKTTAENLGREIPKQIKVYNYVEKFKIDPDDLAIENIREEIDEWFEDAQAPIPDIFNDIETEPPTLFYVKGGPSAGKSTIPMEILKEDPDTYKVSSKKYGRVLFTVFPNAKLVAIGNYDEDKSTGCDGMSKEEILYSLEVLKGKDWKDYSIYMEGRSVSKSISAYFDMMKKRDDREMVVLFFSTSFAEALDRIQEETGKTDEEMEKLTPGIEKEYSKIDKAKEKYRKEIAHQNLGIKLLELNTAVPKEEMVQNFLQRQIDDITLGDVCHT